MKRASVWVGIPILERHNFTEQTTTARSKCPVFGWTAMSMFSKHQSHPSQNYKFAKVVSSQVFPGGESGGGT